MSLRPVETYRQLPKMLPREKLFSNYGVDFDGSPANQQVVVPAFNLVAPYTMIQWIKPRVYLLAIWRRIGTFYFGTATVAPLGRLYLRNITGAADFAPAAFIPPLNLWSMVGIRVLNATTFNFILNDTVTANYAVAAGALENNANMTIGYNGQLPHRWNGGIDEFFHTPTALSDADLQETWIRGYARRTAGSLLNLRMEAGTGLTAFDTSGSGNDGVLTNNPTWTDVAKYELLSESGV